MSTAVPDAAGLDVRYEPGPGPTLVFLHEGLGSVGLWRGFPDAVRGSLGNRATLVYSRHGYGRSASAVLPRPIDFMHHESDVVLRDLLDRHAIAEPVLIGHSDGASIALLYAGAGHRVNAVVAIAPHVFVEDQTVRSIAALRDTDLRSRMARHHDDANAMFDGWTHAWLRPEFRAWNITGRLPGIGCPTLLVQGSEDAYGSMAQLDAIERGVAGPCSRVELEGVGHAPHLEAPGATLSSIVTFLQGDTREQRRR